MACITILEDAARTQMTDLPVFIVFHFFRGPRSATIRLFLAKYKEQLLISKSDGLQLALSPRTVPLEETCFKQSVIINAVVLSSPSSNISTFLLKNYSTHFLNFNSAYLNSNTNVCNINSISGI